MERIQHDLIQGTDAWHQFRLEHDGSSEAPAALGLDDNVSRNELLHAKHTGIAKEFSEFVQTRILDHGHDVENAARPIADKLIGDELFPSVWSYGRLSVSCDGLTMYGSTGWQCKQWNAKLAASVAAEELPNKHQAQVQQELYVTGANRWLFMVTDGTEENCETMWVTPDPAWVSRIEAGWKQFHADLAAYTPPEVLPPVTATPVMALPALSIQVQGSISLIDNLPLFGEGLKAFIALIPEKPSTDQEFADCKEACKKLQEAQDALDAGEAHALGQISSFDQMRRTKALLWDLARTTRLAVEKLVTARESDIKVGIVTKARAAFSEHMANLNKRLGKPYMPGCPENFAGVIKNKRTIASLQDAVDTELARVKILSNSMADSIQINLNTLHKLAKDHPLLFADAAQLVLKANDDLVLLINSRIDAHNKAEADRIAKIKLDAEVEARAKIEAEQKAAAAQTPRADNGPPVQHGQLESVSAPAAVPATLHESQDLIAEFMNSRSWGKDKNKVRAILVEFLKFMQGKQERKAA